MLCENLTLQQKLAMLEKEKHQSVERERDKYSSKVPPNNVYLL